MGKHLLTHPVFIYLFFLAEACIPETTKIPSSDNVYLWPWTLADAIAVVACQNGKGNATRACIKQKMKSPKWGPVDDKACKAVKAKRSEELDGLTNVSTVGSIVKLSKKNVQRLKRFCSLNIKAMTLTTVVFYSRYVQFVSVIYPALIDLLLPFVTIERFISLHRLAQAMILIPKF